MYTTIYQPATQIAARFQTKLCWSCLLHITTLFYNQTSAWSPNCLLCHLEDRILDKNTIIPDLPRERARATSYSEYWKSQRCCEMSHRSFSVVKSPKNRPQNILQYDIGSRCHHVILKIKFSISIEASLMFLLDHQTNSLFQVNLLLNSFTRQGDQTRHSKHLSELATRQKRS